MPEQEEKSKSAECESKCESGEEAKSKKTLESLPDLDRPAVSLYDNERGVWWLGVSLREKEANPVSLMLDLDRSKLHLLGAFGDWKRREAVRRKLIIPRVQSTVDAIVKKGTEAAVRTKKTLKELFELKP